MNDKKFCFIICFDNDFYLNECISYIQKLIVPEGYEVDLITCDTEQSIVKSYNEAMKSTDAKYKIYLHQDTFIVNENALSDLIDIFKDETIGAVGVVGGENVNSNRFSAASDVYGQVITQNDFDRSFSASNKIEYRENGEVDEFVKDMGVLWGCFIATSGDFEWEELWENDKRFYSYVYSLVIREKGFRTVVPKTEAPWCIHDGNNGGYPITKVELDVFQKRFGNLIEDKLYKRILFCYTKEVVYPTIVMSLCRMGYEVEVYSEAISCVHYQGEMELRLEDWLERNDYECLISFEFSYAIAEAAEKKGIKYLSWAWDSPLLQYYHPMAKADTTYAFMFDRGEADILKEYGLPHIYHLPLVTDVYYSNGLVINPEDEKKYSHDVSFIGQMYETKMSDDMEEYFGSATDKARDVFDNHICNWHENESIFKYMDDEIFEGFCSKRDMIDNVDYNKAYFNCMVYRNIAYRERVRILNALGEHFNVDLYTKGRTSELKNINIHEPVHSTNVAPKIFHLSKINLNVTLHCIRTGAPLRVFDIMGVGGFVMSNYQEELAELFVPDKEIVLFKDIDELIEKTDYYLKHEDVRIRIAMNGYKRVRKDYTYDVALRKMFEMADVQSLL